MFTYLVLSRLLFEPALDWRKQAEAEVAQKKRSRQEAKFSIQYIIKNNFQQLKEIAVIII